MSVMITRVAKAMWEQRRKYAAEKGVTLEEWGNGRVPSLNGIFDEARAAIEAMREPTKEMETAFIQQGFKRKNFALEFAAAIDEALK